MTTQLAAKQDVEDRTCDKRVDGQYDDGKSDRVHRGGVCPCVLVCMCVCVCGSFWFVQVVPKRRKRKAHHPLIVYLATATHCDAILGQGCIASLSYIAPVAMMIVK